MIYHNGNTYTFHTLRASFLDEGRRRIVPTSDRQHWEKMVGAWGHLENLSFTPITLTEDQESRLQEVNAENIPNVFQGEVSNYVTHNAVSQEVEHPFFQSLITDERVENYAKVVKESVKDEVRHIRWLKETAGTSVNGISIRTDQNSQQRIGNLVTNMLADEEADSFDFEAEHGVWIEVDRETAISIGKAVSKHVQACFTRCKELHEEIDNTPLDKLDEIDIHSGWPE